MTLQINFLKEQIADYLSRELAMPALDGWKQWVNSHGDQLGSSDWQEVAGQLGLVLKTYPNPQVQALGEDLLHDGGQYVVLYQVGHYFIDRSQFELAVILLQKALEIEPGSEKVVLELCAAYEKQGEYKKAEQTLLAFVADHEVGPLAQYLAAFYRLMQKDLDGAMEMKAQLVSSTDKAADFYIKKLELAGLRAELASGLSPYQRWYFVTTGGLVLMNEPLDLGPGHVLTFEKIGALLGLFQKVLTELEVKPGKVLGFEAGNMAPLPLAMGEVLGLKVVPWYGGNADKGLLPLFTLSQAAHLASMPKADPNLLVLSLTGTYGEESPMAADLTGGFTDQSIRPPWNRHFIESSKTRVPRDKRSPKEIASDILEFVPAQIAGEDWSKIRDAIHVFKSYREAQPFHSQKRSPSWNLNRETWH